MSSPDIEQNPLIKGGTIAAIGNKSVYRWLNLNGLLALFGMAGPLVLLLTDIFTVQAASSLEHHYVFTRDAISILALMPLGWVLSP